jgi:hypothetical protein
MAHPRFLLMIALAECSEVGLRRDSSSAGRRFDPYTAHQTALRAPRRLFRRSLLHDRRRINATSRPSLYYHYLACACRSPRYQGERIHPSSGPVRVGSKTEKIYFPAPLLQASNKSIGSISRANSLSSWSAFHRGKGYSSATH